MQLIIQVRAVALAVLVGVASATITRDPKVVDYADLRKDLSRSAEIYFPGSIEFDDSTARWSNASTPDASIVVVPSNEHDIVKIINFANKNSIPFLAVNGVHGSISTLGGMKSGIQIRLSKLNSIKIAKDGKTATIGGGVRTKDLTDTLWTAGKQAVTGTCECVSYLGPGLGGGHGWLQGRYGLVSDQYISLRLVLADGKVETVGKKDKLFWALKGAGHNFGIVTEVTAKIFDLKTPDYGLQTLIFRGDKVEQVYELANRLWYTKGNGIPVDLINWSYWFFDPSLDPEKSANLTLPVIAFYLIQEGVKTVSAAHVKPFADLGPIINAPTSGTYRDLAKWTGISVNDDPCQITGNANPRFPIYLAKYSPQAQGKIYQLFKNATTTPGSPFAGALFMFEGYPMQGVQALDKETSAFAYREDNLLVAPLLSYKPTEPDVTKAATKLGNQLRRILYKASGQSSLHTYVNYAFGDESKKAWYGNEQWRQRRLRELKDDYDPKGRFNFYAPLD